MEPERFVSLYPEELAGRAGGGWPLGEGGVQSYKETTGSSRQEGRRSPASDPLCFWVCIQVSHLHAWYSVRLCGIKARVCP